MSTESEVTSSAPAAEPPDDGGSAEFAPEAGDNRRRYGTIALLLAVVVGLMLGYASGLLTPGLVRPGDTSAEAGFARDMSTHHAQAVEMAMLAHEKSASPDVLSLSADIAMTQQAQIGIMQTWLKQWKLNPTGSQPRMAWMPDGTATLRDGLMPGMATETERAELRAATGRDFDIRFLNLMLNHHIGGIHMAKGVLGLSDEEQVDALAKSMVAGQQKEISLITSLLKDRGVS